MTNKRIHVMSADSDIGAALVALHRSLGDEVTYTSRSGTEGSIPLELRNRPEWLPPPECDRIYYLLAIDDIDKSLEEVTQANALFPTRYFNIFSPQIREGTEIVVFSSQFGSIGMAHSDRAMAYRISKAALNMGIRCLSFRFPKLRWLVYHPGVVKTKMIAGKWGTYNSEVLEIDDAAARCVKVVDEWNGEFQFLSYTGKVLQW